MAQVKGIIGFVTGTESPWKAQPPVYILPSLTKMLAHKLRALHLKTNKLNKFTGVCVLESGQEVCAPKVKKIRIQSTEFGHCSLVAWEFVKIDLQQQITVTSFYLIDDLGFLVAKDLTPLCLNPGDSIKFIPEVSFRY